MNQLFTRLCNRWNFSDSEVYTAREFFKNHSFSEEGQIYLLTLLAHAKKNSNYTNVIFNYMNFLWETTWRFIAPSQRANLTLNATPVKKRIIRREKRHFKALVKAASLPILDLEQLKGLWKEDFSKLPESVRTKEIGFTYSK